MKILPINNSVFKGKAVFYNSNTIDIDKIKQMSEYHPNSTIETTLNVTHRLPKDMIYFASPMEFVSNDLKRTVDYVVYDNEISYPTLEEIRKNYLETNRTNYRKIFEDIRDYYYRREIGGFASSNEAKYQQWQAATCIKLYDKAGDLRYKKETTEDELKSLISEKLNIYSGISNTKNEINGQLRLKKALEVHITYLKALNLQGDNTKSSKHMALTNENLLYSIVEDRVNNEIYKRMQDDALKNSAYYKEGIGAYHYDVIKYGKYADTVKIYDLIKTKMEEAYCIGVPKGIASKKRLSLDETISAFENILKQNVSFIDEMNAYINELQSKTDAVDKEISQKEAYINECKEKLKPLFEELQNYYLKQGIKIIKK